jgi:hypothetical protein
VNFDVTRIPARKSEKKKFENYRQFCLDFSKSEAFAEK